jgi:hypothetical protein
LGKWRAKVTNRLARLGGVTDWELKDCKESGNVGRKYSKETDRVKNTGDSHIYNYIDSMIWKGNAIFVGAV